MSAMEQLYQQLILDHARAAHGKVPGGLEPAGVAPGGAGGREPGGAGGGPDDAGILSATSSATAPHAACGESFQVNPTCGDQIRLRVELQPGESGPIIASVRWDGIGCTISQASASVLVDLVEGRTVREADDVGEVFRELMHSQGEGVAEDKEELLGDAIAFEGVARYPARVKCALLGWMALRDAIVQASAGGPAAGPESGTVPVAENERGGVRAAGHGRES